jgi:hypothetical protein
MQEKKKNFITTANSIETGSTDSNAEEIFRRMSEIITEVAITIENFSKMFEEIEEEERKKKHQKQKWGAGGKKLKQHSFWN